MSGSSFITGARIFDGTTFIEGKGVLITSGKVIGLATSAEIPSGTNVVTLLPEQLIVPGFVDLQVNGGGGVMLNDDQTVSAIATICSAHAKFGTTALLPTLITDNKDTTKRALAAGAAASLTGVPGFLGLHMEGPHLSVGRKGAHDPSLIRPMEDEDLEALQSARKTMSALMTTVAPENVSLKQVSDLTSSGVKVSIGHTNATYETARSYAEAGATLVTHLFNAMSPLGHREPGLVGAALQLPALHAGLIADGFHVDPATIAIALRGKQGPGRIFLVTDAMSTIGSDMTEFALNGRRILRRNGRLTLEDGTLAGADIDMMSSIRYLHKVVGIDLAECLRMAGRYPADAIGAGSFLGQLAPGFNASFAVLTRDLAVSETWIQGEKVFQA